MTEPEGAARAALLHALPPEQQGHGTIFYFPRRNGSTLPERRTLPRWIRTLSDELRRK